MLQLSKFVFYAYKISSYSNRQHRGASGLEARYKRREERNADERVLEEVRQGRPSDRDGKREGRRREGGRE